MNPTSPFSDLGLGNLPPDDQELIVEKMTESVLKRVISEFLNDLSPEDLEEFESFSDGATPDDIEDFFRSRFPDHDERVQKILEEFKLEMRESLAELDN